MKVAVVTPSIGTNYLPQCVKSVREQTYKNIQHYIFIDGAEYTDKVKYQIEPSNVKYIELEENIGKGWYGHRVYAACSFLVNADIICYLDEDNWYEKNHIADIVDTISNGNDWAYSLRKIYDKEGRYICNDDCESLGKYPVFFDDKTHHIDTSSFGVRKEVALSIGHSWYGQWGADRQFFNALKQYFPKYECTTDYSLCYRLDGNPNSVSKKFFEQGNSEQRKKYVGEYPWTFKSKQQVQVAPGVKIIL